MKIDFQPLKKVASLLKNRVAKWYICIPEIPILVFLKGLGCEIVCPFGIFNDRHLGTYMYFVIIWYILWSFGIFCPVLVC
jgi:hypothetical protein